MTLERDRAIIRAAVTTHHVDIETNPDRRALRRWVCRCGWATDWTHGPPPARDAVAAIRHQNENNRGG